MFLNYYIEKYVPYLEYANLEIIDKKSLETPKTFEGSKRRHHVSPSSSLFLNSFLPFKKFLNVPPILNDIGFL